MHEWVPDTIAEPAGPPRGCRCSLAARVPAERLALIAALTTVVLWASAFVGIRAASVDLTAGPLALGRLLVGSLALGVLVLARGVVRPSRRDFLLIVASGLLWFAFYNVALNEAERNVDAGTASMLTNVGPILVAVFAGLFLGEGFPPRLMAGIGDRVHRRDRDRVRLDVRARPRRQCDARDRAVPRGRGRLRGRGHAPEAGGAVRCPRRR